MTIDWYIFDDEGRCRTVHQQSLKVSRDIKQRPNYKSYLRPILFVFMIFIIVFCSVITVSIHRNIQFVLWKSQRHEGLFIPTLRMQSQSETVKLQLRYNYTSLQRYSKLAQDISRMQTNCDSSVQGYFWYRNHYGLGSDIHVYSVAICNALQMYYFDHVLIHVRSILPWIWYDQQNCHDKESAMTCYFPESEPKCTPNDKQQWKTLPSLNLTRKLGKIKESCPTVIESVGGISTIRAATTEFLFTRISNLVQHEGQQQLSKVFTGHRSVPKNLITVHIRWGDKSDEMKLVPIIKYIDAVHEIVKRRQRKQHQIDDEGIHIFIATEDPDALHEFRREVPNDWHLYVDYFYTELVPYRNKLSAYNSIPQMAKELHGRPGLISLGSLLVAMEANDYVLTTASNWSRLMNEIRMNILNPRCNNCTTMIDLCPGEW
jgi:hypothetical protein